MKAAQHLHRVRDGIGGEKSASEHRFTQSRDFAVFVDLAQAMSLEVRDFQADGVGSDVNSRKGRHGGSELVYRVAAKTREWKALRLCYRCGSPPGLSRGLAVRRRLQGNCPFAAKFRARVLERISRLPELSPGHIAQGGEQRRVLSSVKKFLGFVGELQPVMPIADHVLHALELIH